MFDVEEECVCCTDVCLMTDATKTRLWLPRLVRIAAAAANRSGSTVIIAIISKSDPSSTLNGPTASSPKASELSPSASPGTGVNAIDCYCLKLVAVNTEACLSGAPPPPTSSSVEQAKLGMAAVSSQIMQLQQRLAALSRRRHALPVTDPQEPRLRREIKAVQQQLADVLSTQRLLHRNCAAAVSGGDNCSVLVEAAIDARAAMSTDFNLSIASACVAPVLSDVHVSAVAWPDTVRHALAKEGVRVYSSDKAVAVSADGRVIACCQGSAVKIHSTAGTQPGHQTLDAPNTVLALALHAAGKLLAAAVTSMSGGR